MLLQFDKLTLHSVHWFSVPSAKLRVYFSWLNPIELALILFLLQFVQSELLLRLDAFFLEYTYILDTAFREPAGQVSLLSFFFVFSPMEIVHPEHFVWNHDFALSIFLIRKYASTLLSNVIFTLRNRWSFNICCAQDWWLLRCWALHTYFNKCVRRLIPVRYIINFKVYDW